jgi:hypothetical protein
MSWRAAAVVRMAMPSTRATAAIGSVLLLLGLVGIAIGAVLLVFNTGSGAGTGNALRGVVSAAGMVALLGGLGVVFGGLYLLTRGRVAQTRARTTVPGMPTSRESTSMLPGATLVFVGLVLGAVGIRGATWTFVPAALAGVAGIVLFARSGSPDEPA